MDPCKAVLECLASNSLFMDKGIFDIKMFYSIGSVHSNIGMHSIKFGIDGQRNNWYLNASFDWISAQ